MPASAGSGEINLNTINTFNNKLYVDYRSKDTQPW